MNVYEKLTSGIDEVMTSTKYKSKNTRRIDLCNRYNSAIAYVLASENLPEIVRLCTLGVKGLLTKTIVDAADDDELIMYVDFFVKPVLSHFFSKVEISEVESSKVEI